MTTVARPYIYPIENITGGGGGFSAQMSDHLLHIMNATLPTFHGVIGSDDVNVTIDGDFDLDTAQKATLDALVNRAADYFVVTTDGGVTPLTDPIVISKAAGLLSATTVTLQYKSGDGTNSNGYGDGVEMASSLMPISTLSGSFDAAGKFAFVVGASLDRGTAKVDIATATQLPTKSITVVWT